jgi:predicted HTH transcriptional regulator
MTYSRNPSGIVINPGWYALAGAILGLEVEEAIHQICGVPYGGDRRKSNRYKGLGKSEKILKLYKENPEIPNSKIAEVVGCSREMVRYVLKRAGVPKRNRWENHKSLDKRYWRKEK